MRGDYYVVPPNGARIHTCVRTLLRIAPARGPEGKVANANHIKNRSLEGPNHILIIIQRRNEPSRQITNILYQKGGSAAIPQTN